MPIFITALLCLIIRLIGMWYESPKRQSDWFFKEAFCTGDRAAFQEAMGLAGEKDYTIVRLVFDDLRKAGLI
jgi:hypothetical protein